MRILFIALILFVTAVEANVTVVKNVSAEIKTNDVNQAKGQLLYVAIQKTIEESAKESNIDYHLLQKKLAERFEKYFELYKSRQLTEKFGNNYASNLAVDQKQLFVSALEAERDQHFIRYSRLEQLLDSYAFQDIRKDQENPLQWTARIVLNLNPAKLDKFYKRIISAETKQYSKMLIISEVDLVGMEWKELGLDRAANFTSPIMDSWLKWLESNGPTNVEEIALCTEDCLSTFNQWQDLPQEEGMRVPEDLIDGVWVKISYNLRKVYFNPGLSEWEFSWEGSVVLLDMNTKKILASSTMHPENRSWRGLDQKTLNSQLASAMYRSPLDGLSKMTRKLQDSLRLNRLSRLVIQGHLHLGDVLTLMELLKKEGAPINLELQLDVFGLREAQLLCFYQGEEKSFTDLLSRPKELKSSHSYRLVNEFTGIHHVLKLIAE